MLQRILIACLLLLNADRIGTKWASLMTKVRLQRLRRHGIHLHFVPQGGHFFEIAGDPRKFFIDATSHLKSDTFIECSGGVAIGRYFHPGRGLTIYSATHNYAGGSRIPYDDIHIPMPVTIGDFVWCGANVTILPGITVGEGAVIGAGSVIAKDVPRCAVVGGNPARVIKYRDIEHFDRLKAAGEFE
jgi:acetyltransferase-like isoleucine patch superfamily enzyme